MSLVKQISAWFGFGVVATSNRDDFETNRISLAAYDDAFAQGGAASVLGLTSAWACVNLLAGTIASLPLMVYRTDPSGARTVDKAHALYRILHDSPNADQTALDFWEFMCASVELHGNAFAEIQRGVRGQVIGLTPILPEIVKVRRLDTGALEYEWTTDRTTHIARQEDIFHVRGFGGGPLGGVSTLSVCRAAFASAGAVERAASTTFSNGVRPSGILSTEKVLTGPQRQEAEKLLHQKFAGAVNAGRPMLLDNGVKWEQLTINPEDAQMLESRRFSVEEICRLFGVPPHMIGHTESSTSWGTGLEQQTLGFQKFTLRRRLKRIEQAIEKQLLTPDDIAAGVTIEFSLEGLLRADSKARAEFYASGLQNGWLNVDQVCALENLPPVPGGDVNRVQMQNVPLTEAGAPPAIPDARAA